MGPIAGPLLAPSRMTVVRCLLAALFGATLPLTVGGCGENDGARSCIADTVCEPGCAQDPDCAGGEPATGDSSDDAAARPVGKFCNRLQTTTGDTLMTLDVGGVVMQAATGECNTPVGASCVEIPEGDVAVSLSYEEEVIWSGTANGIGAGEEWAFIAQADDGQPDVWGGKLDIDLNTCAELELTGGSPATGAAPEDVRVQDDGAALRITWAPVSAEEVTYTVERCESTASRNCVIVAEGLSATEFVDDTLTPGVGYDYRVGAVTAADEDPSYSAEVHGATAALLSEREPNNASAESSLTVSSHYYAAEDVTLNLERIRISGSYNGNQSTYSASYYERFEVDCFKLDLASGDSVSYRLISGDASSLWGMELSIRELYEDGLDTVLYTFQGSSDSSYSHRHMFSDPVGSYLEILMWADLANASPYDYEVEITVQRN